MKSLTLAPDWAMLMLMGDKTIEYRTWKTNYRGDIVICSAAKKMRGCISGHALLVAELIDIVPFEKMHMDAAAMDFMPNQNGFAWVFDNFRLLKPVPVKGKLGLFDTNIPIDYLPDGKSEEEMDNIINEFIYPLIFQPARQ